MALDNINKTVVTEFIMLGFQAGNKIRIVMFILLLLIYCFTILMNLLAITLVSTSKNLHTPMYFFISNLSFIDILLTTVIVPKMLHVLLHQRGTIAFSDCMTQLYFFASLEASECLLLGVMSYDRYVAICNPLRYNSIMTHRCCVILVVTSCLVGFCITLNFILSTLMLNFCGPNIIDHFFCDFIPILELSCSDPHIVRMEIILSSIIVILIPLTIIIFSYIKIIITILRIPSSTGRQKAFSTCSSHLIVVSIFFWSLFGVYVLPTTEKTLSISKILSLLYTVFTPLINPIIYSLKNNDIKKVLHDRVHRNVR
ncbi:olfactory receptor 10A7-like [Engystomops pustulosus]|uniref:olfactory receptor 10A7-like n=1 Tax=Engystomops pustulosus TaxID=76066 RepID=UPI003AFA8332